MAMNSNEQINIALKLHEEGNFVEAIEAYKNVIQSDMENYDAWFHLSRALNDNGQVDDAIIAYKRAIMLNPKSCSSYRNLGNIYYAIKNSPQETIECYKKLVEYEPDNTEAKVCLAVSYLKVGNYKEGWKYFESRLEKKIGIIIRTLTPGSLVKSKPLWQGESIKDKTIYVYYEGGFGDTIMFARYLPLLKEKCAKILFRPQLDSLQLFKDSHFDAEILDVKEIDDSLNFDVHTPIMSLPYKLKLESKDDIPFTGGYLKSNPEKVQKYKEKYFDNDKFKIGIKWQGNTTFDINRKITLESFTPLFILPNTKFYSLQKDEGSEQLKEFKNTDIIDLSSTFNDFSDTAAAVENLDLVICNDTSIAHLAGALGKRCWILLPFIQDWRWSEDISRCLWYKSVELFKQSKPQQWDDVFEKIYTKLQN